jgi:hypothetical protein
MTSNKITIKIKMDKLAEAFELINNMGVHKRIKKECEMLFKEYPDTIISVGNDKKQVTIRIKDKDKTYMFTLNAFSFPFTPPEIYINDHKYIEFLNINSHYERNMVKYFTGLDCFCCHSFDCKKNWNPTFKLNNVINEIHNICKIRKNILNKIIADKIKEKYLLPEIDLDCWFF